MKPFLYPFILFAVFVQCNTYNKNRDNRTRDLQLSPENLQIRAIIETDNTQIEITGIQTTDMNPVNKVKAKLCTNQFILIGLKIKTIKEDSTVSSVNFILTGSSNHIYTTPEAWEKIDISDGTTNFDATAVATIISDQVNDKIQIFFEVPKSIQLSDLKLEYKKQS